MGGRSPHCPGRTAKTLMTSAGGRPDISGRVLAMLSQSLRSVGTPSGEARHPYPACRTGSSASSPAMPTLPLHCQRDRESILPGPWGAEGRAVPWQRARARRPRFAYASIRVPWQPNAAAKIVLDAVNLTRWSFCFRRQTRLDRRPLNGRHAQCPSRFLHSRIVAIDS
jgi:hypothetical protein